MSDNDRSFPTIPEANWWKLRELFKQRLPAAVTPSYLATALSMTEKSAQANIIGPFKKIGIIDDQGKPTDLANDWRSDDKYSGVCKKLFEKFYPQEVRDLFHEKNPDVSKINSWFMSYCKCGENAAKKYTQVFILLRKAELKRNTDPTTQPPKGKSSPKKITAKRPSASETSDQKSDSAVSEGSTQQEYHPEIHVNFQIHISPDTPADQIDKIFESMSKHLRNINR
jgi:hypothetical protein